MNVNELRGWLALLMGNLVTERYAQIFYAGLATFWLVCWIFDKNRRDRERNA